MSDQSDQSEIHHESLESRMEVMNRYARKGEITGLYSAIKNDPLLLRQINEVQFIHTPLHEAAAFGQSSFALELFNMMPSFGKKLNLDGLSPLHVALEKGKITTARSLVRMDKQLVRVEGLHGCTPLHYAAHMAKTENELEILADFLLACPDSIDDLNNRLQTAVHVALECNDGTGASILLMNWLTRTSKESILALQDVDGNTALHTAVQNDRIEEVKVLIKIVKLNIKNVDGKTPLDIAEENSIRDMKKILIDSGAQRGEQLPAEDSKSQYLRSRVTLLEDLFRGYYFAYKDFTVNMRGDIMVVAVLIATSTYQAVLQPPGGVYPPSEPTSVSAVSAPGNLTDIGGKMVMNFRDYSLFMPANTVAFTLSMVMIILALQGRPSNIFLLLCLIFLASSYLSAMNSISRSNVISLTMLVICSSVVAAAFGIKVSYTVLKAIIDEAWWMPRLNIQVSNGCYNQSIGLWFRKKFPIVDKIIRQYQLIKH